MKTLSIIGATLAALTLSTPASAIEIAPANPQTSNTITPALAFAGDRPRHSRGHGRRYNNHGQYINPRRLGQNDRVWRGRDGNYYCERGNGTTGLVIGAGLGALAGRAVDTRGDRTVGTLLGAIAGGLIGREIDRGAMRCR